VILARPRNRRIFLFLVLVVVTGGALSQLWRLGPPLGKAATTSHPVGRGEPVQWSPDGTKLLVRDYTTYAAPGGGPSLDVVEVATGSRDRLVAGDAVKADLAEASDVLDSAQWSSDQSIVYVSRRGGHRRLMQLDVRTREVQWLADLPGDARAGSVLWGPGSRALFMRRPASGGYDPNLWLLDVDAAAVRKVTPYEPRGERGVRSGYHRYRWSRDGKRVLFELYNFAGARARPGSDSRLHTLGLWVLDLCTAEITPSGCALQRGTTWLDWAVAPHWGEPETELLAFVQPVYGGQRLKVREGATGVEIDLGEVQSSAAASFSSDGTRVAFTLDSQGEAEVLVADLPWVLRIR
jgi:Tol biopolymer transport system component